MPIYLSDAWVTALDETARAHPGLSGATAGVHLVIEQVVTGVTGGGATGDGEVRWHVVVDDGSVRFVWGPADDPTVRFTTDAHTARAVTEGQLSATEAFTSGRLRVGGDAAALVAHHDIFDGLNDVFAAVPLD